jgi:hypothetical protein
MSLIPHNDFKSTAVVNISVDSEAPSAVLDGTDLPLCAHIAIVSILVGNRGESEGLINLAMDKGGETCVMFPNITLPVNQPFDLLQNGSKIFMNKDDFLKAWTNSEDVIDLLVSYVIYTPSDLTVEP